jgi:hypothetical protein
MNDTDTLLPVFSVVCIRTCRGAVHCGAPYRVLTGNTAANCALHDVMHRLCQDALCCKTVVRFHGTGDCNFTEARKESAAAFLETFFLQLGTAVQTVAPDCTEV